MGLNGHQSDGGSNTCDGLGPTGSFLVVTRTLYPMQFRTDVTDFRVLFLCDPVMLGAPAAKHTHCNTPELPFAALDGCIGLVGGVVGPGKVPYEI